MEDREWMYDSTNIINLPSEQPQYHNIHSTSDKDEVSLINETHITIPTSSILTRRSVRSTRSRDTGATQEKRFNTLSSFMTTRDSFLPSGSVSERKDLLKRFNDLAVDFYAEDSQ